MTGRLIRGDCLEVMRTLDAESVDAVVTDPPYGLEFMSKDWDKFDSRVGRGARVSSEREEEMTPRGIGHQNSKGPYLAARVDSVRVAGRPFQVWCEEWARETLRVLKPGGHLLAFGGSRTYHRLACAVEDAGFEIRDMIEWLYGSGFPKSLNLHGEHEGWGTALKPAHEPIVVARKPIIGTVAANVERYGTGAINVDGCRVGKTVETWPSSRGANTGRAMAGGAMSQTDTGVAPSGRFPANLCLDKEAAALLDATAERSSPSRFFYVAKASRKERGEGNTHPTVKPIALMRWLVRLIMPPNGIVLDPFAGSGTTLLAAQAEGFGYIGIEREAEYVEIARRRLAATADPLFASLD